MGHRISSTMLLQWTRPCFWPLFYDASLRSSIWCYTILQKPYGMNSYTLAKHLGFNMSALHIFFFFFCQCFVLLERTAKLMLHKGSSGLRAAWGAKVRLKVTLTCLHHYSSCSFCHIVPLISSFPLFPCFAIVKLLPCVVLQVSGGQ